MEQLADGTVAGQELLLVKAVVVPAIFEGESRSLKRH
jgi:hypothetical protein